MSNRDYDHWYKIAVLGNTNTGTSELHGKIFRENGDGIDFRMKTLSMEDGRRVKLQVYNYRSLKVLFCQHWKFR